jgi:hypothetical protein
VQTIGEVSGSAAATCPAPPRQRKQAVRNGGGGKRRKAAAFAVSPPLAALTAAGEKGKAWFVPAPSSFPLLLLYFRAGFLASPFGTCFLLYGLMDAALFLVIVILFLLSFVAGTFFGGIFRSPFLDSSLA